MINPTDLKHHSAEAFLGPTTQRGASLFDVPISTFTNWRWQMGAQARDAPSAAAARSLRPSETEGFQQLRDLFQAGVTPYYLSLIDPNPDNPCPIRLQALPQEAELIDAMGVIDPLQEKAQSPVKEVVHIYPDRVAFCVAQLCPVYCRYCFRKRRDGEEGLHFNRRIIASGLEYIQNNKAIRDVLVTGGDPFVASDDQIVGVAEALRRIPHVEIVRFGTRTPVTLPYRVTRALAERLAAFHPVYVNTHFNCVEEITVEATQAVANLVNAGIPVGNQTVLLRGVNDTPEKMLALCRALLRIRIRPYYLFHPHPVAGTAHLRMPVSRGLAIMKALRGNITGLAIPTYVIDTPSGKVPLLPESIVGTDGDDLLLATPRGGIIRERGANAADRA